jgi:hypothetical protein
MLVSAPTPYMLIQESRIKRLILWSLVLHRVNKQSMVAHNKSLQKRYDRKTIERQTIERQTIERWIHSKKPTGCRDDLSVLCRRGAMREERTWKDSTMRRNLAGEFLTGGISASHVIVP